jgi:hypothetical protein
MGNKGNQKEEMRVANGSIVALLRIIMMAAFLFVVELVMMMMIAALGPRVSR